MGGECFELLLVLVLALFLDVATVAVGFLYFLFLSFFRRLLCSMGFSFDIVERKYFVTFVSFYMRFLNIIHDLNSAFFIIFELNSQQRNSQQVVLRVGYRN